MLIRIAWRNIWRNRSRSLILVAAVALGLWAGLFLVAFYNGMIQQRIESAIGDELSHFQVHHPEFTATQEVRYVVPRGRSLLDSLQALASVEAATGRVRVRGMIASSYGARGITLIGVVPDAEARTTHLDLKVIEGDYFSTGRHNQILVSRRTADRLKLGVGKKTILTFEDAQGSMASAAYRIAGIYQSSNGPLDERQAYVEIRDLDSLAGIHGQLNEVAVKLGDAGQLPSIQQDLQAGYPDLEIRNWQEISPELGLTVSVIDNMIVIIMGIILLALAFGLVNTMLMSVLERTREIGMLLALGMSRMKVFRMVLLETVFLIFTGAPIGLGLGLLTIAITHRTGITLEQYREVYAAYGYKPDIYPTLVWHQLELILAMILFTAFVAALFPARRALRMTPAEALKT